MQECSATPICRFKLENSENVIENVTKKISIAFQEVIINMFTCNIIQKSLKTYQKENVDQDDRYK